MEIFRKKNHDNNHDESISSDQINDELFWKTTWTKYQELIKEAEKCALATMGNYLSFWYRFDKKIIIVLFAELISRACDCTLLWKEQCGKWPVFRSDNWFGYLQPSLIHRAVKIAALCIHKLFITNQIYRRLTQSFPGAFWYFPHTFFAECNAEICKSKKSKNGNEMSLSALAAGAFDVQCWEISSFVYLVHVIRLILRKRAFYSHHASATRHERLWFDRKLIGSAKNKWNQIKYVRNSIIGVRSEMIKSLLFFSAGVPCAQ